MLDRIRRLLAGAAPPDSAAPAAEPEQRLQLAVCVLLLEVAHADGEFTAAERARIEESLGRHFGLEPAALHDLMTRAEPQRAEAADLHQFTSVVSRDYDEGQRMVLAEVLWSIVFADGTLSNHESYLMHKLGNLLDLRPGFLSEARRRATRSSTESAGPPA